jgi:DNA-binding NarL/FixJ family response regulator
VVAAYPALRAGLRALLATIPGIDVVADASQPPLLADGLAFDLLVADLGDEPEAALEGIEPGIPAVLLADWPGELELADATAGPRAFLARGASESELRAAVMAVAAGLSVLSPEVLAALRWTATPVERETDSTPLTDREREVLELLSLGLPNKQIARRLGISDHTAKFHVGAILSKLGAASRTEAVTLAARRGLLAL